jgi:hypothetical protein
MKTNNMMKYIVYMVDLAASPKGPSPADANEVNEAASEIPRLAAMETKLQSMMDNVTILTSQLRLSQTIAEAKGRRGGLIQMPNNHNCMFQPCNCSPMP